MAVITISREYGGGANHIAGLICDGLGFRYFDKALMMQLGVPRDLKETLEAAERPQPDQNPFTHFFHTVLAFGNASLEEPGIAELPCEVVEKFVREAYDEDNVVIVGRGGQMVLAGKPDVLHVRIVAPMELRIHTVAEFEGLTSDVARDRILRWDQAATDYVRQNYSVDPADPSLYDVVLNMAKLTPQAGANMIVAALGGLAPRAN